MAAGLLPRDLDGPGISAIAAHALTLGLSSHWRVALSGHPVSQTLSQQSFLITTSNAVVGKMSRVKAMPICNTNSMFVRRIFGGLLGLILTLYLSGCSVVRLGYGQLPDLGYWWVDSYLDLDDAQSVALRNDLAKLFDWHRSQELLPLAQALTQLQALALQDTTSAAVCRAVGDLRPRLQALADQSAPALTRLAVSLKPEQLTHLQHQLTKRQQSWRDDWLSDDPAKRLAKRSKRLIDRSEMFYGRLSDTQRTLMRSGVAVSGFDPALMQTDLLRRHQDMLQTAQLLAQGALSAAQAQAQTTQLLARLMRSPDADYRQHMDLVNQENCQIFADLHNSTTPAQKQKLADSLKGYELDARALMPTVPVPR